MKRKAGELITFEDPNFVMVFSNALKPVGLPINRCVPARLRVLGTTRPFLALNVADRSEAACLNPLCLESFHLIALRELETSHLSK